MILQEIELFEGIDPEIMNEIVNICSEENYPQNTVLFKMGEEAECLYILEEGIMAIKVLIKRHMREGKAKEVFVLLNKSRADAMNQKGYITGETLMSHHDPHRIVVISTWQTIENWLAWKENKERKANEARLEQYLEFPTEYEEYVFGTFPQK